MTASKQTIMPLALPAVVANPISPTSIKSLLIAMGISILMFSHSPVAATRLTTTDFVPGSSSDIWDHHAGYQIKITSSGDTLDDIATGGGTYGPDDFYFELSSTIHADGNWFLDDIVLVYPSASFGAGLWSYADTGVAVRLGAVASAWISDPADLIEKVNSQTADTGLNIDHYEFVGFDAGISSFMIKGVSGDANFDGIVDVADLGIIGANFNTTTGNGVDDGDLNGDGVVDVADLGIIGASWSTAETAGSSTTVVPEPTTLSLFAISVLMVGYRWR